jgi:hypothetical protein
MAILRGEEIRTDLPAISDQSPINLQLPDTKTSGFALYSKSAPIFPETTP